MTTDFDEFCALVTAPLARLKIKKMVREIESSGNLAGGSKDVEVRVWCCRCQKYSNSVFQILRCDVMTRCDYFNCYMLNV